MSFHDRILRLVALGGLLAAACTGADDKPAVAAEDTKPAPAGKTKAEGRVEPVGVQTQLEAPPKPDAEVPPVAKVPPPVGLKVPMTKRGCDPVQWCGPKAVAKSVTVRKKPASLGCPAEIGGEKLAATEKKLELSRQGPSLVDEPATAKRRASGDEDTCCYVYQPPCNGKAG